jgi:hypothetical protein
MQLLGLQKNRKKDFEQTDCEIRQLVNILLDFGWSTCHSRIILAGTTIIFFIEHLLKYNY